MPETTSPERYGQDPDRLHDRKLVDSPTVAAYLAGGSRLIRREFERRSYAVDRFPGCRILTNARRLRLSKATAAATVTETHATDPTFRPRVWPSAVDTASAGEAWAELPVSRFGDPAIWTGAVPLGAGDWFYHRLPSVTDLSLLRLRISAAVSVRPGPFFDATARVLSPHRLGVIGRGLSAALAEILRRVYPCDRPVSLTLLALLVQVAAVLQSQLTRPRSALRRRPHPPISRTPRVPRGPNDSRWFPVLAS